RQARRYGWQQWPTQTVTSCNFQLLGNNTGPHQVLVLSPETLLTGVGSSRRISKQSTGVDFLHS
ncbi:MAG: hypothetical protein AAB624_03500, partial [Patescibacteria group bacterium]